MLAAHAGEVYALAVWRGRLVSGGEDGRVHLFDLATRARLAELNCHGFVRSLAVASDGQLACGSYSGRIDFWHPTESVVPRHGPPRLLR